MISSNLLSLSDLYSLSHARVKLSNQQLQMAAVQAEATQDLDRRWQKYRSTLGLIGFEQWLEEQSSLQNPEFQLERISSAADSLDYPCINCQYVDRQAEEGRFKICIIAVDAPIETEIDIPTMLFQQFSNLAHFYVLMEVVEDEDEVSVRGFLSYAQYQQQQRQQPIPVLSTGIQSIPVNCFNLNPDVLLLQLRCLEPSSIVMPASFAENFAGAAQAIVSEVRTSVMTVSQWFQNQIDEFAAELGWMLMPAFSTGAMRGVAEVGIRNDRLEQLRLTLQAQNVEVSDSARGIYRNLVCSSQEIVVYALAWELPTDEFSRESSAEWTLLIVVENVFQQMSEQATTQLTLSIRDEQQVLAEESLNSAPDRILYAQVIGELTEQFWVTVRTQDGGVFEFEPFQFNIINQ